jgi:hypothetical protein
MGNNICPLFTMLTKQNLIKILHSELVKKKCLSNLLGDPPILKFQELCFLKENGLISMDDLPFLKFQNCYIFTSDLPLMKLKNRPIFISELFFFEFQKEFQ